jgi:two-component system, NtrC family, response regulator HydG
MMHDRLLSNVSAGEVGGILEVLPSPAVVIRRDFTIVAANRAFQSAYRRADGGCAGARCHLVTHNREQPCSTMGARCPLESWNAGVGPVHVMHEHRTALGSRHEEVTAYPIADEHGRTTMFLELVCTASVEAPRRFQAVGCSAGALRVRALIDRVAPTETPVLLLGESGTGKELAAAAIHAQSPRSGGPFVPLDCSSIPGTLFEAELFGHERGAFTGAAQARRGLVEAATGGTIFLDEIGDLPLPFQVKLLRLVEAGTYRRIGSTEPRRANFRLVCATHCDLEAMVKRGTFRRDLYYRISAFPIVIPPLRERLSDLPLLTEYMLNRIAPGNGMRLHPDALSILLQHSFPGNVRELLNILQRAALLADQGVILPEHLPLRGPRLDVVPPDLRSGEGIVPLEEAEGRYLRWALTQCPNGREELAARLGISERTLFRKLSALTNTPPEPRPAAEAGADASAPGEHEHDPRTLVW